MRILVYNKTLRKSAAITSDFVPRVGDSIDLFYSPLPTVRRVVAWPSLDTVKHLGGESEGKLIEVLVVTD